MSDSTDSTDSINNNDCAICYEKMNENQITLKCKHTFHYDCILNSYKHCIKNLHISLIKKPRLCPYCRNNGGYLPLRENTYPFKGIHLEYYEIEQHLIRNDIVKLKEITDKYINKKKCNAIIKTGLNKGYQCKKNKQKNTDYCHLHLN